MSKLGLPDFASAQRRPDIKIWADKINFSTGRVKETIDITNYVTQYTWQKTIANPASSGSLSMVPQYADTHMLDYLSPMDVIRIHEFGKLKFQGYIVKVGMSGAIGQDGKPKRSVGISLRGFGGYLVDTIVGVNLALIGEGFPVYQASIDLATAIFEAGDKSLTFKRIISELLIPAWFDYVGALTNSTVQQTYIENYVNFTDGVTTDELAGFPKDPRLFYGDESEVSLWSVLQKLMEAPLNEFFFDEGPRNVYISGSKKNLRGNYTYMVARPTPFDGTVVDGVPNDRFSHMNSVVIPRNHLVQFDFNKSMEEVYSVYLVAPVTLKYDDLTLIALGDYEEDATALKKYMYRLCNKPLYYMQNAKKDETASIDETSVVARRSSDAAKTYKNWYEKNDQYLSGTIKMMVPDDGNLEPRIGDKVSIENIDGAFYAESCSRQWTYGGAMTATIGVTRGYDYNKGTQMKMANRLFARGKNVLHDS